MFPGKRAAILRIRADFGVCVQVTRDLNATLSLTFRAPEEAHAPESVLHLPRYILAFSIITSLNPPGDSPFAAVGRILSSKRQSLLRSAYSFALTISFLSQGTCRGTWS